MKLQVMSQARRKTSLRLYAFLRAFTRTAA
jgi:hypothetical protein